MEPKIRQGYLQVAIEYNKCLLTGASGLLGKNLLPLFPESKVLTPTSTTLDITSTQQVKEYFQSNPDIDLVVHAAAYTDVKKAETDFMQCHLVNVIGTYNILEHCVQAGIKMVYISTDAVFDGSMGFYHTDDPMSPISKYDKSKTAAELMVRTYENSLIIRTSFFGETFPYDKAFVDQWTSKDYIDIMAPKIFSKINSNKKGISHVSSNRRSLYELALIRKKDVTPCHIRDYDYGFELPKDLSLKQE